MNGVLSNIWTYTLTSNSIFIDDTFGFTIISVLCTTGSVSITGSLTRGGFASTPIILLQGQGITISGGSVSTIIISDITIDATSGTAILQGR
jgi:hypothetical protein